jgi:hypothetical protein
MRAAQTGRRVDCPNDKEIAWLRGCRSGIE